jgi:hypothetical protein
MNLVFARVMTLGVRLGVSLVAIGFLLYLTGWVEPLIPVERVPALLGENARDFVAHNQLPGGWLWLGHLHRSDMLSLGGVLALILVSVVAYGLLVPMMLRQRDSVYLTLVLMQLAVFFLAALGLPW